MEIVAQGLSRSMSTFLDVISHHTCSGTIRNKKQPMRPNIIRWSSRKPHTLHPRTYHLLQTIRLTILAVSMLITTVSLYSVRRNISNCMHSLVTFLPANIRCTRLYRDYKVDWTSRDIAYLSGSDNARNMPVLFTNFSPTAFPHDNPSHRSSMTVLSPDISYPPIMIFLLLVSNHASQFSVLYNVGPPTRHLVLPRHTFQCSRQVVGCIHQVRN